MSIEKRYIVVHLAELVEGEQGAPFGDFGSATSAAIALNEGAAESDFNWIGPRPPGSKGTAWVVVKR